MEHDRKVWAAFEATRKRKDDDSEDEMDTKHVPKKVHLN